MGLHWEAIPPTLWLAFAAGGLVGVALAVFHVVRTRRVKVERRERRLRRMAHQRAWDWLFGNSRLRLTDQRDSEREV